MLSLVFYFFLSLLFPPITVEIQDLRLCSPFKSSKFLLALLCLSVLCFRAVGRFLFLSDHLLRRGESAICYPQQPQTFQVFIVNSRRVTPPNLD